MKWIINDTNRRKGHESLSVRAMFTRSDARKAIQRLKEREMTFCYTRPDLEEELLLYLPCARDMLDNFRKKLTAWVFDVGIENGWIYGSDVTDGEPTYFINRKVLEIHPGPRSTKSKYGL